MRIDSFTPLYCQERQSLLHCLSDTNRTVTRLMFEKDKLAERLSRTQAEATKELSGYIYTH
jgi:hypothetical protein